MMMGGTSYFVDSTKHGFNYEDNPTLSEQNKWLAMGIHKSTRYVKGPHKTGQLGPHKTGQLGVIIDCKFPFPFK